MLLHHVCTCRFTFNAQTQVAGFKATGAERHTVLAILAPEEYVEKPGSRSKRTTSIAALAKEVNAAIVSGAITAGHRVIVMESNLADKDRLHSLVDKIRDSVSAQFYQAWRSGERFMAGDALTEDEQAADDSEADSTDVADRVGDLHPEDSQQLQDDSEADEDDAAGEGQEGDQG